MSTRPDSTGPLADLRSALDRLTRPPLLVLVAAFMLVLLLAVVGRHLGQLEAPSGGRIDVGTGDFMAFWTGAVFIHEGRGSDLYDYAAQQELQGRLLGGSAPEFQPYLNPPLLAVLLSPLVPLGYLSAFYLYDLVCVVCLGLGLLALLGMVPRIRAQAGGMWAMLFLIAGYQPMIETTLGGQNTAITFALLAALSLALQRGCPYLAALVLGLLTYKPQYAVGIGTALLLAGQWRVVTGGALLGIGHYLLGAWWSGAGWPIQMLEFIRAYRPLELAANAETHFSWVRTADFLLPTPLDTIVAAFGVLVVLAAWWQFRRLGRCGDGPWMALVVCGTMLASPHLQYYDVALLALPVCLLIDRDLDESGALPLRTRVLLAAAYAGYPLWEYAEFLRVQPLFLMLLAIAAWALRDCYQAQTSKSPQHAA